MNRTNFGLYVFNYNLFGRNHTLKTRLKTGYNKEVGIEYRIPFISEKSPWGVQTNLEYKSQNEVWYETKNDSLIFFKNGKNNLIRTNGASITLSKRVTPTASLRYSVKYNYSELDTSVPINNYFINNQRYQHSYGVGFQLINDSRNNIFYPTSGQYFSPSISVEGWQNSDFSPNIMLSVKAQRFDALSSKWSSALSFLQSLTLI